MELAYEITGDVLDAIVLVFLYDILMGRQYRIKKVFLFPVFIGVVVAANFGIGYISNPFLVLCSWQAVFFGLTFLYQSKVIEKIISSVAFNIMGGAAEMIVVSMFSFLGEEQLVNEYYYVELMISKLIVFVLVVIISLVYKRKRSLSSGKYRYFFLSSLIISILELVAITYIMLKATDEFIPEAGIVAVAVVVLNFILYLFVDGYSELYAHKEREMMLEKSMHMQEESYEQLSNSYMQMRRILHDTNKHMKTIAGMIENNGNTQALEYIDATLGEVNSTYKKFNTGNVVIDVMLSNLVNQCEAYDIQCETEVAVDNSNINIDNRDMAIILGNLTENAINYEKSILAGMRRIDIAVLTKDTNLIIDIRNTCYDEKAAYKKDCGIENIERVVEKYSGTYSIVNESDTYKSSIILPFSTLNTTIQYK